MPHVVVTGMLSFPLLGGIEDTVVHGLPRDERESFMRHLEAAALPHSEDHKKIKIKGKGFVLEVLNRLEKLFGYQVVSHAMTMISNTNHERMSWTLHKKATHLRPDWPESH